MTRVWCLVNDLSCFFAYKIRLVSRWPVTHTLTGQSVDERLACKHLGYGSASAVMLRALSSAVSTGRSSWACHFQLFFQNCALEAGVDFYFLSAMVWMLVFWCPTWGPVHRFWDRSTNRLTHWSLTLLPAALAGPQIQQAGLELTKFCLSLPPK